MPTLDTLTMMVATPAATMVGAALLEALLPRPDWLRLSASEPLLSRLGHRVHRPDGTPKAQWQAGILALIVVWLPCAAGLWAVRNLALSEPLFDLLFLLLMLESRPLRTLSTACGALLKSDALPLARLQAAPWLKRETGKLSAMGLAKALCEAGSLRLLGGWAGPLLGFALGGVQGALLWRLAQLTQYAWSCKQPAFVQFGRPAAALHQGLAAPAALLLALPNLFPNVKEGMNALRSGLTRWPHPAAGALLASLAHRCKLRLGGPRYYQGTLVRLPVLGDGDDPSWESPRQLLRRLQCIGWGWLALALLLTLIGGLHG
ncbi:MAG: cobalamin biosynthesis protein [Aeromonas molluscorum]